LQEQVEGNASNIKKLQKFSVSGYIQTEAEISGQDGKTKTGASNSYSLDRDNKDNDWFMRYGIRRGRIKFTYTEGIAKGVFEMDINEGGIGVKNAYLQIKPHQCISLQAGLMDRWFGDEVEYSSSNLEPLERSLIIQKLFPDEKDLGLKLTLSGMKNTMWDGLKLDLGLVSGNNIKKDDDGRMDFLAHLKYNHSTSTLMYGIGTSLYSGTTNNIDSLWFTVNNNAWQSETVEKNKKNKRQYVGFDGQIAFETLLGLTNFRAEYIFGTQPSVSGDLKSPNGNTYTDKFNYNRKFSGGYFYAIQDIYNTPLTLVLKYAYLDNNTEIAGNDIKNAGDLSNTDYGFGMFWRINSSLRLTAMYDINKNETTNQIAKYSKDIKDNIFTLRLQYKF
jgi:phosphate-selective porin